jgi:5-methylcytosine-specific restriction endonuclease McrA
MDAVTRRFVRERTDNRCEYCRLRQEFEPFYRFHIEHVVPRQHGGGDTPDNLALACHHDNKPKGTNLSGIDPRTGKVVRLFHPRRQRWDRHFRLDGPRIVGRTACGRATVAVLDLNHPDRVGLRYQVSTDDE